MVTKRGCDCTGGNDFAVESGGSRSGGKDNFKLGGGGMASGEEKNNKEENNKSSGATKKEKAGLDTDWVVSGRRWGLVVHNVIYNPL